MVGCTSLFRFPFSPLIFLLLGLSTVFGFAPFNFYLIPPFTLLLFLLVNNLVNQNSYYPCIIFGLGFFLGGLYWVYISLNIYGQMPPIFAGLSTLFFCIFLSIFFLPLHSVKYKYSILIFPAIFTITEWFRSFIFTGFPWLSFGYSQVYDSPLSGYLAVLGVHGVTFLLMLTTIACFKILTSEQFKVRLFLIFIVIGIWLGGNFLKKIEWSIPQGDPISLSLIQGNISQDKKWDRNFVKENFLKYLSMIESSNASLIILPETSIPVLEHNLPKQYKDRLKEHANKNNGNILYGVIEQEGNKYFNSAISIGADGNQTYQKFHLVPFGEFIPLKKIMQFVYERWLKIPFSNLSRGDSSQKPMVFGKTSIAVNICYEDVFGNEIIKPLPEANILINLSNDAWYGESIASQQHLQISQARAIETGRMMLRATNTGATAIINSKGKIIKQLPLFKEGVLNGYGQGYEGTTPYIKYGNFPIIILSSLILLFCIVKRKISKK